MVHQLTCLCCYLFHQGPSYENDAVIRALRSSPQQVSTFLLHTALQASTDTLQLSLYMLGSQPRITLLLFSFQPFHVKQEQSSQMLYPPHMHHKFDEIIPQLKSTSYIIAFTDGSLQEQRTGCGIKALYTTQSQRRDTEC